MFRKDKKIRKPSTTNLKSPSVTKSKIIDLLRITNIRKATEEHKIPLRLARLASNDIEGS